MDKLDEFVNGLQAILDSPNAPHGDLVQVLQSTQREFLFTALSVSTLCWPTNTHLELVKIIIGLPVQDPVPETIIANPSTNHEIDPFFAAQYFDRLCHQLMSTSIKDLAESDGSWVRNIGFSIEATVIQACRRADALERWKEQMLTQEESGDPNMQRIAIYCTHVLSSGTLALRHWEAMARMVFAMFYILSFSTKSMTVAPSLSGNEDGDARSLNPPTAKMIAHYGSWLQIVLQMIENHGPALCKRMPTVIEDPSTKQFRWGIPTLHSVATTEILRNQVMRCMLLNSKTIDEGYDDPLLPWTSSMDQIDAEEQRLADLEHSILGKIIALDASSVYGMMADQHHLLQSFEAVAETSQESLELVAGTTECLAVSLTRTCHGLAPILGFEKQALMQAMDMGKLLECVTDMKTTALRTIYSPFYGYYPQDLHVMPTCYAESMLLRMATALFNIDQPWDNILVERLCPSNDIPAATKALLDQTLHTLAIFMDVFSLDTSEPIAACQGSRPNAISSRLLAHYLSRRSDEQSKDVMIDNTTDSDNPADIAVRWLCEFLQFGMRSISNELFYTQLAIALARTIKCYYVNQDQQQMAWLVDGISRISFKHWQDLASFQFHGPGAKQRSTLGIIFTATQSLPPSVFKSLGGGGTNHWLVNICLCYPRREFLAYVLMTHCTSVAQGLVDSTNGTVRLNQAGIDSLKALEQTLSPDGGSILPSDRLLFGPRMHLGTKDEKNTVTDFAWSQMAGAVQLLRTVPLDEWAKQLGSSVPSLLESFSQADMELVAQFISCYVEQVPTCFPAFSKALSQPINNDSSFGNGSDSNVISAGKLKTTLPLANNPFAAPNILSRLPLIESAHSTSACDILATVRKWKRNLASLPVSQCRQHIRGLIGVCYQSSGNAKHYLDLVLVAFMEAEPVIGAELVIGVLATLVQENKTFYSSSKGLFVSIYSMFSSTNKLSATSLPAGTSATANDRARVLARSGKEPVFNAVVGGKVRRPHTPSVASTEEKGAFKGSIVDHRLANNTVENPALCQQILLQLSSILLESIASWRDNLPLRTWLTDCLDRSPSQILQRYFSSMLDTMQSETSANGQSKVKQLFAHWGNDSHLRGLPMIQEACVCVVRYIVQDSVEQDGGWMSRWKEWEPFLEEHLHRLFTKLHTCSIQGDIVKELLKVELKKEDTSSLESVHPVFLLGKIATIITNGSKSADKLFFSDSRDWFLAHVMPHLMTALSDPETAVASRAVLERLLASVSNLHSVVPWKDIATSLVQNAPHSHGSPVAMTPEFAKKHFVAYVPPLARILFGLAHYVEGDTEANGDNATATTNHHLDTPDMSMADTTEDESTFEKSGNSSPAPWVSPSSIETAGDDNDQHEFAWAWLDEWLVIYLNDSSQKKNLLDDTIDALVDVYTFSSVRGLRQSIDNAVVAICLHSPAIANRILRRIFSKRPMGTISLHSIRPKILSGIPPLTNAASDTETTFRAAAELYPLVKRVLKLAMGGDNNGRSRSSAHEIARIIAGCMWGMTEEPDIRRGKIALRPRLVQKDKRPDPNSTDATFVAVRQAASGRLHDEFESKATSSAYAVHRSVYLLGLLFTKDSNDTDLRDLSVSLAHSRLFMATLMIAVGENMRSFSVQMPTYELLCALWNAAEEGKAVVNNVSVEQIWKGVNFYGLSYRNIIHIPEEYTTWQQIQSLGLK